MSEWDEMIDSVIRDLKSLGAFALCALFAAAIVTGLIGLVAWSLS